MWCLDMGMAMQACQACGVSAPADCGGRTPCVPNSYVLSV